MGTLRLREHELEWLIAKLDVLERDDGEAKLREAVRRELAVTLDTLLLLPSSPRA